MVGINSEINLITNIIIHFKIGHASEDFVTRRVKQGNFISVWVLDC